MDSSDTNSRPHQEGALSWADVSDVAFDRTSQWTRADTRPRCRFGQSGWSMLNWWLAALSFEVSLNPRVSTGVCLVPRFREWSSMGQQKMDMVKLGEARCAKLRLRSKETSAQERALSRFRKYSFVSKTTSSVVEFRCLSLTNSKGWLQASPNIMSYEILTVITCSIESTFTSLGI
jgi:hypothetical protein